MASATDLFTIAANDQSVYFLGQIFGHVGGVLQGSGSLLLSRMFGDFNNAVLVLGSWILGYTAIKGVLATAQEGEFLGRKMHSLWVPLRSIIGVSVLVPGNLVGAKGSYCAIQVAMMWVIMQGIGAADQLWNTVVDYLASGSAVTTPASYQDEMNKLAGQDYVTSGVTNIFTDLVCRTYYAKGNIAEAPSESSDTPYTYDFNKNLSPREKLGKPKCGSLNFAYYADNEKKYQDSKQDGYSAILPTMQQLANLFYTEYKRVCNPKREGGYTCKTDCEGVDNCITPEGKDGIAAKIAANLKDKGYDNIGSKSAQAYAYYGANALMSQTGGFDIQDYQQRMKNLGWLYAGSYYYGIATIQNKISDAGSDNLSIKKDTKDDLASFDDPSGTLVKTIGAFMNVQYGAVDGTQTGASQTQVSSINTGNLDTWGFDQITGGAAQVMMDFLNLTSNADKNETAVNPIIRIQQAGKRLIGVATTVWIVSLALAAGIGGLTFTMAGFQGTWGATTALFLYMLPVLISFCGSLILMGATMAVYVPLVPYIFFTFASIGWFVGVIETMIAAPIVAIGLMHPEGQNEMFGKAEPAVMLITNIFLRPSLMIFGMMAGMLLSYVVLDMINAAFFNVMKMAMGFSSETLSIGDPDYASSLLAPILIPAEALGELFNPVEAIMYVALYLSVILISLNKCFALIYIVPDKILKWLAGGYQAQFGEEAGQMEQKLSREAEGTGAKIGKARAAGEGEAIGRGKAVGRGKAEKIAKDKEQEVKGKEH